LEKDSFKEEEEEEEGEKEDRGYPSAANSKRRVLLETTHGSC
jgi:hypothetical protein